jgi:hypothetical protein
MKKILILGVVFALFTVTASAQTGRDQVRKHRIEKSFKAGQLTRGEKYRLHKNQMQYRFERRRALRDGYLSPVEKKRLHKMRVHDRRESFRYKHNKRKSVI